MLLDEQMPGKRGLDALRELREADPHLLVVMVTKSEEDSTMTEAIGAALEGYLVKPVTPRQVYAAISGILDGPRLRQQAITRRFVERFACCSRSAFRIRVGANGSIATAR